MRKLGMDLGSKVTEIETIATPASIPVDEVSGTYFFDDHGITLNNIAGSIGGNGLLLNGRIDGYTPDAPIHLHLETKPHQLVTLPENLSLVSSLPDAARHVYEMLRPSGSGTLWMQIDRDLGQRAQVTGEIHVVDASFTSRFFPYPISHAAGLIVFDRDPKTQTDRVRLRERAGLWRDRRAQ